MLLGPAGGALARLIESEAKARRGAVIAGPGGQDTRPNFPDAAIARLDIAVSALDRIETSAARRAGELKVEGKAVEGGSMIDAIAAAVEERVINAERKLAAAEAFGALGAFREVQSWGDLGFEDPEAFRKKLASMISAHEPRPLTEGEG